MYYNSASKATLHLMSPSCVRVMIASDGLEGLIVAAGQCRSDLAPLMD